MTTSTPEFVIGVDLGGTKILAAVADAEGRIYGRSKRRTLPKKNQDAGPDIVAARMARAAREAVEAAGLTLADVTAVGASAPGPVDVKTGRVYRAVNLPHWESHYDLGPVLAAELGVPVFVDNDVNLGTLGEATYGAARGVADVIGIFVGTGIGGGVILDGKLRRGFRWAAGEIGHKIMHYDGQLADVEAFASRGAISKRLRKAVHKNKSDVLTQILARRGDDRITSGVIRDALAADDRITQEAVREAQEVLGLLIASVVNLLDPESIVMGGGLVESLGDDFLEPVREVAYSNFFLQDGARSVKIVPAGLGDGAVALGGAVLAFNRGMG